MPKSAPLIRLAEPHDDDFILSLAPRFAEFTLPRWRSRGESVAGIRSELARHLEQQPANSHLFVAEDTRGRRAGFIHLQKTHDFFNGRHNCHIADLAVASSHEGLGFGKALLAHAERWASEQRCHLITLAVFPGNQRAQSLYAAGGYETDLLRLAKSVSQDGRPSNAK